MGKRIRPSRLIPLIEKIALLFGALIVFFFFSHKNPDHPATSNISVPETEERAEAVSLFQDRIPFTGGEVFFDAAVGPGIASKIDAARREIVMVSYTFDKGPVADALERAADRGVKIIAGAEKNRSEFLFHISPLQVEKGIMHEKYLVIDTEKVIISSMNFTGSDASNSAIYFDKAPLLAGFLIKEAADLFSRRDTTLCAHGCRIEYGTLYLQPGKACGAIRQEIQAAGKSIDIAMYTITQGTPMMTGLKKRMKKGNIEVNAIFDDWRGFENRPVNKPVFSYLRSLGAVVRFDGYRKNGQEQLFHHKFAVIDGKKLIYGSMNWTKSGCYKNRELLMISDNVQLAEAFESYFGAAGK